MIKFSDLSKNIMIVDALNLAFRYKHSGAITFSDDYINTVNSLATSYKAGKIIIACDSGSSSYRKSILPTYKQARKDKFEQQTEDEKIQFELFFEEFGRTIEALEEDSKYCVFKFPKCEADDIAAYIVKKVKDTTIWLMSSDKDWDLLIRDNVSRFSYVTRKEITLENWNDHYEYDVYDHISIKCLMGDTGDSVPGVPGIGPKKAHALIKEYGTTYDIIANIPIKSRYKYIQSLNEFGKENLLRNYLLMDLLTHCDEALGKDNCATIDNKLKEYLQ